MRPGVIADVRMPWSDDNLVSRFSGRRHWVDSMMMFVWWKLFTIRPHDYPTIWFEVIA